MLRRPEGYGPGSAPAAAARIPPPARARVRRDEMLSTALSNAKLLAVRKRGSVLTLMSTRSAAYSVS